jgi:hypothetical protein
MKKVVFLDFDGVINGGWNKKKGGPSGFDWSIPEAVANLNSLFEKTGAAIVVSSSWRQKDHWPADVGILFSLEKQLVKFGLDPKLVNVIGVTPDELYDKDDYPVARIVEIRHWIKNRKNDVDSFIVIDDQDITLDTNNCKVRDSEIESRIVRTETKTGFCDASLARAVELLNSN